MVARRVVNSHPSRLEMVRELWKNHPKLIVFYNFNYELQALRSLLPATSAGTSTTTSLESAASTRTADRLTSSDLSLPALAEWNGHKHQEIPKTDSWLYLAQYTAAAEAWNCIDTDAMAFYSKNYSWKVTEQSEGRIDRLNTPFDDLWYYRFGSDSWIDKAIDRSLKAKKTFNETKYKSLMRV
jgi:hypothetical protein